MKAIFLGCLVAVFASCTKPDIDWNPPAGGYTDVYTFPPLTGTGESFIDSNIYIKAGITADGVNFPMELFYPNVLTGRIEQAIDGAWHKGVIINASDTSTNTKLILSLLNINSAGTYKIDNSFVTGAAVIVECTIADSTYADHLNTQLSGTLTIDTLSTNRIHGLFNVSSTNGTKTLEIKNGSFAGNLQ